MYVNSDDQLSARVDPNNFDLIIDESITFIRAQGVSDSYIRSYRGPVRHFLIWLFRVNCAIKKINTTIIERFLAHDCDCRDGRSRLLRMSHWRTPSVHIIRFVRFLEQSGRIETYGVLEEGMRIVHVLEQRLHDEQGYSPETVDAYRRVCLNLVIWLHFSRVRLSEVTPQIIERFHKRQLVCSIPGIFEGNSKRSLKWQRCEPAIRQFLMHLAESGHIKPLPAKAAKPLPKLLERFSEWLKHHRGNCASTRKDHLRRVGAMFPELGTEDLCRYDAALIRKVLFKHMELCSDREASRLAMSMRMFVQFLICEKVLDPSLIGAVPSSQYRDNTLPRHIPQADVERAIASCDDSPIGVRDRAILLLLARLALRAGDVVNLRCRDIDWQRARIRVSGKSRQTVELPLPQDVGDAVYDYLSTVRPTVHEDQLFLCARAPWRAIRKSNTISGVAHKALDRAGVVTHASRGAHVFRHSQATNLLRTGASLDVIQTLLRHENADTTAIYAKTDIVMLAQIAQPWIEGVSS